MADEEQLRILRKGVEAWNRWREEHPDIRPDLSGAIIREAQLSKADLHEADLRGANLVSADLVSARLWKADLRQADLSGAYLMEASLWRARLRKADLSGADLRQVSIRNADLSEADLSGADLRGANLTGAGLNKSDLRRADLSGANLREARLRLANFSGAKLSQANLSGAIVDWTVFDAVDLSDVEGLESVVHWGPSMIGVHTIYRSQGRIPEVFLRGAGVPEEFIIYMRSLVWRATEYLSCFISYSSKDEAFAERLHADLQAKGVRCWFAPEDMKIGDKIRDRLDQSIRLHDKLLVILSEHSIGSDWVEDEVETAFEEERKRGQTVLFPVRLDEAVMETGEAWAAKVRQRHIGDFRAWKEHDAYRRGFERLVRDLKTGGTEIAT